MDVGLGSEPPDISEWEIGTRHSVEVSIHEDSESLANPNPSNEHVGVDDEYLYIDMGPGHRAPPISTRQSEPDTLVDDEIEKDDIVTDRLPARKPDADYDKNDPPMAVGTIYSDMNAFKLALATHATKYEFQYEIEKSDKTRYRVYCSGNDVGCRWRIHASTLSNEVTVQITRNPYLHENCHSTRRAGTCVGVTQFWVCEQVIDWLKEDGTLGAKELRRRLKEKFKIDVTYRKVYLALEIAQQLLLDPQERGYILDQVTAAKEELRAKRKKGPKKDSSPKIKSLVDEGKYEEQFEQSDEFQQQLIIKVREILTEKEWRRRKVQMRILEEEGRKDEEETNETRKRKRDHGENWEETRDQRFELDPSSKSHMGQYLVSCLECGLLLKGMQEIQKHGVEFNGDHSKLLLSLDGTTSFTCCQCDVNFYLDCEMIVHKEKTSHNIFIESKKFEEIARAEKFVTPVKSISAGIDTMSDTRTVKKAPKMKEHQTLSAIPFSLSDDDEESDNVFNMVPASGSLPHANEQPGEQIVVLHKVRSLNHIQLLNGDIEDLREKFLIAEGVTLMEAKRKVRKALASWDEQKKTFNLVGTQGANSCVFEERLQQVCLVRTNTYECASDKAVRMYQLLNVVLSILEDNIVLRIRCLYYLYPQLHVPGEEPAKQMKMINETVSAICLLLEVTRESLNLFASPHGLISGPLLLFSDEKLWVNCNLGGPSGCLIPSESVFINGIRKTDTISFVLVLEKDTIFHYLCDHGFVERHNCVLVTGKGQADLATRILLRKMRDHFKGIPFYCMVDANPYGANIFCTYRFGSEERAYDSLCLTVPDLEYIGLNLEDVAKVNQTAMIGRELNTIRNLLSKNYVTSLETLRRNLTVMQDSKAKADIERIMADENLEEYILKQIKCAQAQPEH